MQPPQLPVLLRGPVRAHRDEAEERAVVLEVAPPVALQRVRADEANLDGSGKKCFRYALNAYAKNASYLVTSSALLTLMRPPLCSPSMTLAMTLGEGARGDTHRTSTRSLLWSEDTCG